MKRKQKKSDAAKIKLQDAMQDLFNRCTQQVTNSWDINGLTKLVCLAVQTHASSGALHLLKFGRIENLHELLQLDSIPLVVELTRATTRFEWLKIKLGWLLAECKLHMSLEESYDELPIIQLLKNRRDHSATFQNSLNMVLRHAATSPSGQDIEEMVFAIACTYAQSVSNLAQDGHLGLELAEAQHRNLASQTAARPARGVLPDRRPFVTAASRAAAADNIRNANLLVLNERIEVGMLRIEALETELVSWRSALALWQEQKQQREHDCNLNNDDLDSDDPMEEDDQ